jgi:hypothetical protein
MAHVKRFGSGAQVDVAHYCAAKGQGRSGRANKWARAVQVSAIRYIHYTVVYCTISRFFSRAHKKYYVRVKKMAGNAAGYPHQPKLVNILVAETC